MRFAEALDDPALLGPMFTGPSYAAWRTYFAALFAEPMTDEQLAIYREHTGRQAAPTKPSRESALIIGRRGGKSRGLAAIAVWCATCRDYSEYLVPGEVPTVAIVATDRRQGRIILRYIIGTLRAVPLLAGMIQEELAESVVLTNGVTIEIHTGTIGAPRGRTFIAVLCDEIAFWRSDLSVNPDAEVIAAVRPGLASIPNSLLLMASSPYAKRGILYQTFRKHYGQDNARTLVWKAGSLVMNPTLDPELIEEEREEDPARASSEYDANFRDDIAQFVSREVIDACTFPDRHELPRISTYQYKGFVDPSGGSADSMTMAVAHAEGDTAVLDCVREVRPPFSPETVVSEFATLLKSYGLSSVTGDRYGGEFCREPFRKNGIDYQLSDRPKSDIYRDMLPVLNSGKAELLDLPRLASQLCGLERRTARGGRDSIDHPPGAGSRDDLANAAAGALLMAGKRSGYDSSLKWV